MAAAPVACGGTGGATAAHSSIEVRAATDHPRLGLVAREGDPTGAEAVAIAHDLGGTASLWLGVLLEQRLSRVVPTESRPSGNGLVLRARVKTEADVARAIAAVSVALRASFTEEERGRARERFKSGRPARAWTSPADAAVSSCIGEPGDATSLANPTLADLERWRTAVLSTESVAFAVVGPRALLDAAEDALQATPSWPRHSALEDAWPASDVIGFTRVGEGARTLSVALRTAEVTKALVAAKSLAGRDSPLLEHARALGWDVENVSATGRARGACLRVDLTADAATSPGLMATAGTAALAAEEMRASLALASSDPWDQDRSALEASDPRDAAAIAAWRALSRQLEPGAERVFVSAFAKAGDGQTDAALASEFTRTAAQRREPTVDVVRTTEGGQGEQWLLLANPCATATESTRDAGRAALAARSLAAKATGRDGVRIEPWISTDGIGLLAHGPKASARETVNEQARRIATALGRALAGSPIADDDAARARTLLLAELTPEMEPLWPAALEALSPNRVSWLDARGTWQSVNDLSVTSLEVERRYLLRGPLRLAVVSNAPEVTTDEVERAVDRWLRPEREAQARCPTVEPMLPKPGEYAVEPRIPGGDSQAIVGVTLPPQAGNGDAREARLTAYLLNRANGWLDSAVRVPGLALHAQATVLGNGARGALVVQVAAPQQKARDAAMQVRALFGRLAEGSVTADELKAADKALNDADLEQSLDPRQRIVKAWLGTNRAPSPDVAALRRFHRQTLTAERHVLVVTRPRP
jgi:hypothetical protein